MTYRNGTYNVVSDYYIDVAHVITKIKPLALYINNIVFALTS